MSPPIPFEGRTIQLRIKQIAPENEKAVASNKATVSINAFVDADYAREINLYVISAASVHRKNMDLVTEEELQDFQQTLDFIEGILK